MVDRKGRRAARLEGRLREGTGWELNGGKGNGSSNFETIAKFGLHICCRVYRREQGTLRFNQSGQPSLYPFRYNGNRFNIRIFSNAWEP
jgi:hypothetical protein